MMKTGQASNADMPFGRFEMQLFASDLFWPLGPQNCESKAGAGGVRSTDDVSSRLHVLARAMLVAKHVSDWLCRRLAGFASVLQTARDASLAEEGKQGIENYS